MALGVGYETVLKNSLQFKAKEKGHQETPLFFI
jgi:hypothetical protein